MIRLSQRQIVIAAVLAGVVVLPAAGWATERADRSPSPSAHTSASPPPPSPVVVTVSPSPSDLGPTLPPGMAAPVGWKLSDIPQFAPPPPPEPITLPPGNSAPYISRIPTTQKVAFLTIDDGLFKSPEAVKLFAAAHIPVTLFLEINAIRDNPKFFIPLTSYGAVIETHTITHPDLAGKSYALQHHEICDGANQITALYGRRPMLFRPPYGDKDATTLQVVKQCGLKAAFFWKETVDKGIVRYQEKHVVQPGDIILMHFRPAFIKDFIAALRAIKRAGLTPALLENYIPGAI